MLYLKFHMKAMLEIVRFVGVVIVKQIKANSGSTTFHLFKVAIIF